MEAASRPKLGVGMDTVASLSPLRHPSASSACKVSAASPRLLKLKQRIISTAATTARRPRSSASGAAKTTAAAAEPPQKAEKDLVFVAGATGRVGSRAVRELIKLGFRVRAAVRNAQRASSLVKSVQQLKLDVDAAAISPAEKLEIVECDLEKQPQEGIVKAIGNASLVVCSIGASEKEILDVTGPYRIDYLATSNLVRAATAAKVEHFILVTSLGTNKIGFPAFLLNLFWGVLCWKRRAEEALIASSIPYTIVRPGGMERPTDAFKETHNLVAAAEDTYVGGLVSNLQVAELIGCMANNRRAAYCKVLEVVAETTAPLLPMEQLLSAVPSKREPPAEEETEEVKPAAATAGALSPYTAYEELKPPSSLSPTPSSSDSLRNKKPQQAEEAEAAGSSRTSSRPLSPYTAFVDLKPPSSPSPSSSSSSVTDASTDSSSLAIGSINRSDQPHGGNEVKQERPLSPYTRFVDLKPPSSPSPSLPSSSSSSVTDGDTASSSLALDSNANNIPVGSSNTLDQPQGENEVKQERPLSPYTRFVDLKPPSSPSPSPPSSSSVTDGDDTASSSLALDSNANGTPTGSSSPSNQPQGENEVKQQRPLSPYTRYAELKPPSSPTPSAPKT